ncbi:MAG: hypothetical protein IJT18_00505 [Oscillospiraceae bacterium]|nr:hypothetical protein [Oscillospiraceae bacterium]
MVVVYILFAIIALVIDILIAKRFQSIAEDKGYSGSGYFWLCLLLGVVGYTIVAALPDMTTRWMIKQMGSETVSNDTQRTGEAHPISSKAVDYTSATHNSSSWKCKKCGSVNAGYVSSCSCGQSKRENG